MTELPHPPLAIPPARKPETPAKPWETSRKFAKRLNKWLAIPVVIAAITTVGYYGTTPKVAFVTPQWTLATETLATSGTVEGWTETTLGADVQGTLVRLVVDENDSVRKGQVLAFVQDRSASNAVAQAEAALRSAEARLAQSRIGSTPQERRVALARLGVSSEGEVRAAQAVDDAKIARSQADTELRSAKIAYERAVTLRDGAKARSGLAELQLNRIRALVEAGALAGARLDEARTDAESAAATLNDAEQAIHAAQSGIESAELAAQRSSVACDQAKSAWRAAQSSAAADRAEYDRLVSLPLRETVSVAEAGVREARAGLSSAISLTQNSIIRAPFDGSVTKVLCRPGATIGSTGLLRLVETARLQAKADVDESDLDRLAIGQRAILITPAAPDHAIAAHIFRLSTGIDANQGTVEATIVPDRPDSALRPGGTVDVTIVLAKNVRRLLVPTSAVRRRGDETVAFTVHERRVVAHPIRVGRSADRSIPVLEGLTGDDRIVRDAAALENGQRVRF